MDKSKAERLGPENWVDAAYEVFEREGLGAIRIGPLAMGLGVTRGSFYWHFRDRSALLGAVLSRWGVRETESIISNNERLGGSPSERLARLLEVCASDDGHPELGIREWATGSKDALEAVQEMDARRMEYLTELAHGAGVPLDAATSRARIAYRAWLSLYTGVAPASPKERISDMGELHRMMVSV